jgi:histidinol-phosphate aminotransferase
MPSVEPNHPFLETIEPYRPPDMEGIAARAGVDIDDLVRLNANENPFGPAPGAMRAVAECEEYGLYPHYEPLQEALARYAGVAPEQVVLGNGADELIDLLIRLYVEPGQAVLACPPTFGMYRFCAHVNRCDVLFVPSRPDFSIDVQGVEKTVREQGKAVRLLFLVSPGNPSGRAIPLSVIERLLALPVVVAVDEAYIEFGGTSAVSLLDEYQNLVVLRTFSKWAGMAGLRLGYALLAPHIADYLECIRPPYNVNTAAMAAALAILRDKEATQANVDHLIAQRERLQEALAEFSWLEPLPSEAVFILCRLKGCESHEVFQALAQQGVIVRWFSGPRMKDYIRISVGSARQNDALLAALRTCSMAVKT